MTSQASPAHTGRIDGHSHQIPGVDDGCRTVDEPIACARELVAAGYTHSFCTPHIWPNLPENNVKTIVEKVRQLQAALDQAFVPLKLLPGGEITLREDTSAPAAE